MYARVTFACNHFVNGFHQGDDGSQPHFYESPSTDIPVNQWVHFEIYLSQASDYTGAISFGRTMPCSSTNRTSSRSTLGPTGDDTWSVNAYSDGTDPNPATIHIDDATIGTDYIP
jgi:hypothetical protein